MRNSNEQMSCEVTVSEWLDWLAPVGDVTGAFCKQQKGGP